MRERLRALGLESFVKTTGGKGLHEWAELRKTRFDPSEFTILSVPTRVETQREDPWREMAELRQSIVAASWRSLGIEKP